MTAWYLDASPGTYQWGEVAVPDVGPDDVRVTVKASALNRMDLWLTKGLPKPKALPHVPGGDVAGVIDAAGERVTGWSPGDEVVVNPTITGAETVDAGYDSVLDRSMAILGEQRWGGHGTSVVVPARNLVARPAGRSWAEAAAYPTAHVTAWRMLRRARLTPGDVVLVVGVGSGVSAAALALAHHLGADVHVTSRDPAKLERAVAMGAAGTHDSAQPFDVRADIVIESVGPATWDFSLKALKPGGRMAICGGTSGSSVELSLPKLFWKQHELIGSSMGSYLEFDEVTDLVAAGAPVTVDAVLPLERYPDALERLSDGAQLGKIVLAHGDPDEVRGESGGSA
jgi:NADPH:quinone reductase-like Zn-dependent oxidoreductase